MIILIILSFPSTLSSIFLQRILGSSILYTKRIVCVLPYSLMYSSPWWVVLLLTYYGYEATMMLVVVPGLTTRLSSFLQSLVP